MGEIWCGRGPCEEIGQAGKRLCDWFISFSRSRSEGARQSCSGLRVDFSSCARYLQSAFHVPNLPPSSLLPTGNPKTPSLKLQFLSKKTSDSLNKVDPYNAGLPRAVCMWYRWKNQKRSAGGTVRKKGGTRLVCTLLKMAAAERRWGVRCLKEEATSVYGCLGGSRGRS